MSADRGIAYVDKGWSLDSRGNLVRAASIVDRVRRLLSPLWGPVWNESYRGTAARPKKAVDAIDTILADRIRLVLKPLTSGSEISELSISVVAHPTELTRRAATISFLDADRVPRSLSVTVRIG